MEQCLARKLTVSVWLELHDRPLKGRQPAWDSMAHTGFTAGESGPAIFQTRIPASGKGEGTFPS